MNGFGKVYTGLAPIGRSASISDAAMRLAESTPSDGFGAAPPARFQADSTIFRARTPLKFLMATPAAFIGLTVTANACAEYAALATEAGQCMFGRHSSGPVAL